MNREPCGRGIPLLSATCIVPPKRPYQTSPNGTRWPPEPRPLVLGCGFLLNVEVVHLHRRRPSEQDAVPVPADRQVHLNDFPLGNLGVLVFAQVIVEASAGTYAGRAAAALGPLHVGGVLAGQLGQPRAADTRLEVRSGRFVRLVDPAGEQVSVE